MSIEPDNPELPLSAEGGGGARGFSLLSHDLRSALSDVLGGIRLIEPERLDAETRAHLERIAAAGEVLARLLDKAVDEADAGGPQPGGGTVNLTLRDFLDDIRKRWSARAREKGVGFEIETGPALPAVVTLDRVALDRIIANLLGNAVKFTDRGTVRLRVSCNEARTLAFTISDDGPGLSPEALARLFQFQGRPGDNGKPGSGLGLFIARQLSRQMGASLRIANRPGGGAEAELLFPQDAWFERSLRREPPAAPGPGDSPDLSGLHILLAEDNKTNQLVATQMLKALGADFSVAADGLEALELLEREPFDLALLDIEMPRMTGLELIRELRARPEPLGSLPLVALTAYVMREHRERIFAAGADGIIAKPITSIDSLGRAVRDHLQGGAAAPAPAAAPPPESGDSGPAPAEVVDRARFDSLVETIGADSMTELLAKLQSDTDAVAEGLGRGRASLDLAEIRSQTHILISVAGAIGATGVQHAAQRLNAAANRQDAPDIDALCGECLAGLKALQGFILEEQAKAEAVA